MFNVKNILLMSCLICIFNNSNAQNATTHPHSSSVRNSGKNFTSERLRNVQNDNTQSTSPTCSCGVFLSGQFVKGSPKPPEGNPAIVNELEDQFTCGTVGVKQCANKCLEGLVKYLPNSPSIICGSIDRDCFKERAYLFINNCNNGWTNTNFSAGREYCCKNGNFYKCPAMMEL